MPIKLIYRKAVSTHPPPGHLPFISSSTLRTHLAPRHPTLRTKNRCRPPPEDFFSGTALSKKEPLPPFQQTTCFH